MSFEEWDNDTWKIQAHNDRYYLKAPGVQYGFTRHDFLELHHRINIIAETISTKDTYYIHDNQVHNRETGEQYIGTIGDCEEMNRLHKENLKLKEKIKEMRKND